MMRIPSLIHSLPVVFAAGVAVTQPSDAPHAATKITMTGSDAAAYASALTTPDKARFKPSRDAQFYRVTSANTLIGYLYSETQNWKGDDRGPCLLTWLDVKNSRISRLETIGSGDFDAETCQKLDTIGTVGPGTATKLEIGTVYSAASPNADVHEPVVVTVDLPSGALTLDSSATEKGSQAGVTTLPALRNVLGR